MENRPDTALPEGFCQEVMEASLVGIYVIQDLVFRYVNKTMADIFGYQPKEMIDRMSPADLVIAEQREQVSANLSRRASGEPGRPYEVTCNHRDGRILHTLVWGKGVMLAGKPASVGTLVDITVEKEARRLKREMEARVQQTQKLESLSSLAGGVAHDLNNILAAIMGNADFIARSRQLAPQLKQPFSDICAAAKRASELSNQLFAYVGKGTLSQTPLSLSAIVRDLAPLLKASIPKGIDLSLELDSGLVTIRGDATQLRQVLLNLVINGSEATSPKGTVAVRVAARLLDASELAQFKHAERELVAGRYAIVEVEDTGSGIAPDVIERIFEPYFSTKRRGRGLGLSAVLGIIRRHGGALRVTSQPGVGTRFQTLLPLCDAAVSADVSSRPKDRDWGKYAGLMVLVVDDEPALCRTASRIIEQLGLEVITAKDGVEALEAFRLHEPGCVLLDLNMPRLGGVDTYQALCEIDDKLSVILCSGHHDSPFGSPAKNTRPEEGPVLLSKPYGIEDLEHALWVALARRDGEATGRDA
jgi:PAS domain S-box-containing protein